jgi:hypothetical protein
MGRRFREWRAIRSAQRTGILLRWLLESFSCSSSFAFRPRRRGTARTVRRADDVVFGAYSRRMSASSIAKCATPYAAAGTRRTSRRRAPSRSRRRHEARTARPVRAGSRVESVAPSSLAAVRMTLAGARAPRLVAGAELSGRANYLRGSDATAWRTNVPSYDGRAARRRLRRRDLVYSGTGGRVEYDFVVSPGGDPGAIPARIRRRRGPPNRRSRRLVCEPPSASPTRPRRSFYQRRREAGGGVRRRLRARADGDVGFDVGASIRRSPSWIDPVLASRRCSAATDATSRRRRGLR